MKFFALATIATVSALDFESMNEDELLAQLSTTLSLCLLYRRAGGGISRSVPREEME